MSLEFIAMVSMAMIILTVFLLFGNELLQDSYTEQRYEGLRDVGYTIQSEVILAARSEIGYNRTFFVPDKINKLDYTLVSTNKSFALTIKSTTFTYFIPLINGTIEKGYNTILTNETEITIIQ